MLHIAGLLHIAPGAVQLVQFHCHLPQVLQIKCLGAKKCNPIIPVITTILMILIIIIIIITIVKMISKISQQKQSSLPLQALRLKHAVLIS